MLTHVFSIYTTSTTLLLETSAFIVLFVCAHSHSTPKYPDYISGGECGGDLVMAWWWWWWWWW